MLAPVSVTLTGRGLRGHQPVHRRGHCVGVRGDVQWELSGPDGVVKRGFATAQECCTVSPYAFEVTAPPGTTPWWCMTRTSDGEGNPQSEDTKRVSVR